MVKEKVLITGGAGYLGSVLTGYLLEKEYNVICLDNLKYKQNSLLTYASNPNFDFIYGDVRDEGLLKKIVSDSDVIIPLAAIVGMPACNLNPEEAIKINRDAIVKLNEIRSPDQKIIYPTTNSGYGTQSGEIFCTEETPLEPISLYGKTKVETEKYLIESEKPAITLRLATVFGISSRMRTDLLVNDFVLKAVRDNYVVIYQGDFKRNFIHVRDVARAFEYCIENFEDMKNEPYNVGLENANLSKIELAEKIKSHIPKFEIIPMEIGEDPDNRNYIVSNQKILRAGFSPEFSLDEGIKELKKGYNILLKNELFKNV